MLSSKYQSSNGTYWPTNQAFFSAGLQEATNSGGSSYPSPPWCRPCLSDNQWSGCGEAAMPSGSRWKRHRQRRKSSSPSGSVRSASMTGAARCAARNRIEGATYRIERAVECRAPGGVGTRSDLRGGKLDLVELVHAGPVAELHHFSQRTLDRCPHGRGVHAGHILAAGTANAWTLLMASEYVVKKGALHSQLPEWARTCFSVRSCSFDGVTVPPWTSLTSLATSSSTTAGEQR